MKVLIEACALPSRRAIDRIDSLRSIASQISALSASENRLTSMHPRCSTYGSVIQRGVAVIP